MATFDQQVICKDGVAVTHSQLDKEMSCEFEGSKCEAALNHPDGNKEIVQVLPVHHFKYHQLNVSNCTNKS